MGHATDTAEQRADRRGLSRRDMIKGAAVAGAAAWTAPVIIDSLTSPAAAGSFTCATTGNWYVALYSPSGQPAGQQLVDRPGGWNTSYTYASYFNGGATCTVLAPPNSCGPTLSNTQRATAANIKLTNTSYNIRHDVSNQAQGQVALTLDPTSCCIIKRVVASVHQYQSPDSATPPSDCPSDYCQVASTNSNAYLRIVGGALDTKSVTVQPNTSTTLCQPSGIHWGSPNGGPGTNPTNPCNTNGGNGYSTGQPAGYLLIEIQCGPGL